MEHDGPSPSHLDLLDVKKNSNLCLTLKQKPDDMAQYFTFSQISISQKIHHPRIGRHMQPVHVNTYKSARNSNQFAKNLLQKNHYKQTQQLIRRNIFYYVERKQFKQRTLDRDEVSKNFRVALLDTKPRVVIQQPRHPDICCLKSIRSTYNTSLRRNSSFFERSFFLRLLHVKYLYCLPMHLATILLKLYILKIVNGLD